MTCSFLSPVQVQRKAEKVAYQKQAAGVQARMLGTMRRLVYAADQLAKKDKSIKAQDAYIHRLEQQMLVLRQVHTQTRERTLSKSTGPGTRCFSQDPGMASHPLSHTQQPTRAASRAAAATVSRSDESWRPLGHKPRSAHTRRSPQPCPPAHCGLLSGRPVSQSAPRTLSGRSGSYSAQAQQARCSGSWKAPAGMPSPQAQHQSRMHQAREISLQHAGPSAERTSPRGVPAKDGPAAFQSEASGSVGCSPEPALSPTDASTVGDSAFGGSAAMDRSELFGALSGVSARSGGASHSP